MPTLDEVMTNLREAIEAAQDHATTNEGNSDHDSEWCYMVDLLTNIEGEFSSLCEVTA